MAKKTPNPLNDDDFYGNDDHIDALKDAVRTYATLHDMISDMIESGRLTQAHIPDDYPALVDKLVECVALGVTEDFEDNPFNEAED
jgi:hypothetical protein